MVETAYTNELQQEAQALLTGLDNSGVHAVFYNGELHIWFECTVKGIKTLICEKLSPGWQERAKVRIAKMGSLGSEA